MSEDFRYEFIDNCRDVCLSELLTVIIRDYIPSLAGPYVLHCDSDTCYASDMSSVLCSVHCVLLRCLLDMHQVQHIE